eukprot:INCI226.1.p1 GENE.INCI226.1~~INCI226.1.p1  ORF type:complete len:165 (+),score=17.54 INCI226.1:273-767(+)
MSETSVPPGLDIAWGTSLSHASGSQPRLSAQALLEETRRVRRAQASNRKVRRGTGVRESPRVPSDAENASFITRGAQASKTVEPTGSPVSPRSETSEASATAEESRAIYLRVVFRPKTKFLSPLSTSMDEVVQDLEESLGIDRVTASQGLPKDSVKIQVVDIDY